jgi:hypothetical protein
MGSLLLLLLCVCVCVCVWWTCWTHPVTRSCAGGVSMGDHDFVKPTLAALGKVHFGRLAMKPGVCVRVCACACVYMCAAV